MTFDLEDLLDPDLTEREFTRRRRSRYPTAEGLVSEAIRHPTYFGKVPNSHVRRDRQLIDADGEAA